MRISELLHSRSVVILLDRALIDLIIVRDECKLLEEVLHCFSPDQVFVVLFCVLSDFVDLLTVSFIEIVSRLKSQYNLLSG
jgi:hypothetical protein